MRTNYYFAYGSNMLQERLERRVGPVNKIGTHRIYGYALVFNCQRFANIVKAHDSSYIEGVVYELTSWQIYQLDEYEGFYTREEFDYKGNPLQVYVGIDYICSFNEIRPNKHYLAIILAGCLENNLITLYNTLKEKFQYKLKLKRTTFKRRFR